MYIQTFNLQGLLQPPVPPNIPYPPNDVAGTMTVDIDSGTIETINCGVYQLASPQTPSPSNFFYGLGDFGYSQMTINATNDSGFLGLLGGNFTYVNSTDHDRNGNRYSLTYQGAVTPAIPIFYFTLVGTPDNGGPAVAGEMAVTSDGIIQLLSFGLYNLPAPVTPPGCQFLDASSNEYASISVTNSDEALDNFQDFTSGSFVYTNYTPGTETTVTYTGSVTLNQ